MATRKSITFLNKLQSVNKDIKKAFFISLISILMIEICFKNYQSPFDSFFTIGDIYLKICYSIFATSIFFLINQHLPKEKKNLKMNKYIRNKMVTVSNELSDLMKSLNIDENINDVSEEIIKEACERVNPEMSIEESRINKFANWRHYLKFKTFKIKVLLNEVLVLNSVMETEMLERVLNMLNSLDMFFFLDNDNVSVGKDLNFYAHAIFNLVAENKKAQTLLRTKRYQIYTDTNMNEYLNLRKK